VTRLRGRISRLFLSSLLLLPFGGCEGGGEDVGVASPRSASPLPTLVTGWGSEGHVTLGELDHFDVDAEGRLALLDRMNARLHLLEGAADPGGGGLVHREVGGRGGGPGELMGGQGVRFVGDGSVAVLDPVNARLSRWDLDGRFLDAVRVPGLTAEGIAAGEGWIHLKTRIPGVTEAGMGLDLQVVRWRPGEPGADTLLLLPSRLGWAGAPPGDTLTCGPCGMERLADGSLALQRLRHPGGYRYTVIGPEGRVRGVFGRDRLPPVRHTPESWSRQARALDAFQISLAMATGLPVSDPEVRPLPDPPPPVPFLAYPHAAAEDGAGRIWVLRGSADVDRAVLDVFDPGLAWIGEVPVEVGLTSIRAAGPWLAGRVESAVGEPAVVLFRIVDE
jgi:hypothetical protein